MKRRHFRDHINQRLFAMRGNGHIFTRTEWVIAKAIAAFVWALMVFIIMKPPMAAIMREQAVRGFIRIRVEPADFAKLALSTPSFQINHAVGRERRDQDIALLIIAIRKILIARETLDNLFERHTGLPFNFFMGSKYGSERRACIGENT